MMNTRDAQLVTMLRRGNGTRQLAYMFSMPQSDVESVAGKHGLKLARRRNGNAVFDRWALDSMEVHSHGTRPAN